MLVGGLVTCIGLIQSVMLFILCLANFLENNYVYFFRMRIVLEQFRQLKKMNSWSNQQCKLARVKSIGQCLKSQIMFSYSCIGINFMIFFAARVLITLTSLIYWKYVIGDVMSRSWRLCNNIVNEIFVPSDKCVNSEVWQNWVLRGLWDHI